jgi:tRNA (guanine37-N1)-methyltransferase
VLTGGELPALILLDAIARLQPGVLGDNEATDDDSFSTDGLLEYPQWTKPADFRGWKVPEIMQNGNLGEQLKWKRQQSLIRTLKWRPDLLEKANLSETDWKFIQNYLVENPLENPDDSNTEEL